MKKQIVQTLWRIANGQPQEQGEKIVYPNIREQLNAMKAIMSIKGWDELDFQEVSSSPASSCESSIISEEITANCQQTTIAEEEKASDPQEPTEKETPTDPVVTVVQEQPLSQQSTQQPSTKCTPPKKISVGKMKRMLRRGLMNR